MTKWCRMASSKRPQLNVLLAYLRYQGSSEKREEGEERKERERETKRKGQGREEREGNLCSTGRI